MQVLVCLFVERWHIANVPVYVHVGMVKEIVGTYKIQYHPDEDNTDKVYTCICREYYSLCMLQWKLTDIHVYRCTCI